MNLIDIADHECNTDSSARIVMEDRQRGIDIYSVRGGFVATCFFSLKAIQGKFHTKDEAMSSALSSFPVPR